MIGNTAENWSYYRSRSDSDVLRVWIRCSPSVPRLCGVKIIWTGNDLELQLEQASAVMPIIRLVAVTENNLCTGKNTKILAQQLLRYLRYREFIPVSAFKNSSLPFVTIPVLCHSVLTFQLHLANTVAHLSDSNYK
jgi:hypothetical protein